MMRNMNPILPSSDIDATLAFYTRLGFHQVYRDDSPGYLLVGRDSALAHFYLDTSIDPAANPHSAFIYAEPIDELSSEWAEIGLPASGSPRFEPATDRGWGMRELVLVDPDGNTIRAGQETAGG